MITSKANPQIKMAKTLLRRSGRDKAGMYLVEGVRLTEEALRACTVETLFYSSRLLDSPRGAALLDEACGRGVEHLECSEQVLSEISDTVTTQGVVAVVKKESWKQTFSGLVVVADEIRDPGNLGTLFRTAVAAGATGIILTPGCVDPYNSKVVRASMGGVFRLPHWEIPADQGVQFLGEAGVDIVVADIVDSQHYFAVEFPANVALVIGNEARGPSPIWSQNAAQRVKIPLYGEMESLNASVAAGILLYEIARQHHILGE